MDRGQDHELVRDAEDELLLLQLLDVLLLVVQYRRPVLRVRAVLDQLRVERGVDQVFLRSSRRIRRLRLTPLAMRILRGRLAPLIEEIQLTSRAALLACCRLQGRGISGIADLVGRLHHRIAATQLLELLDRLVLDIAFDLLKLPLHGLAAALERITHLLLFIVQRRLHDLSEQYKAQILQLCALLVVEDPVR